MLAALLLLTSVALPAEVPAACAARTSTSAVEESALVASAAGLDHLVAGDVPGAIVCLERARAGLPESGSVARDLALAYYAAGRRDDALREVEAALALGDWDAEARELRAILLAATGRTKEAADAAHAAGTWESALVAASLGDEGAAWSAAELANEETGRGALASLVLASHAGARGDVTSSRLLLDSAMKLAAQAGEADLENAARTFEDRLDQRRKLTVGTRLRASLDHATSPAFGASAPAFLDTGVRAAFLAESALDAPLGIARVDAALRLDQQVYLDHRELFHELDLTGLTLAASVELPISRHPSAALIGFAARYQDTFGDLFRVHYASTIEGGPRLTLPVSSSLRVELAIWGIATDFIDKSPAGARISSQNRDFVGRRAILALDWSADWLDARAELMYLRDDARGDAFDARGGAVAGRLRAHAAEGLDLGLGFALTARDFGPVGDAAIIGPAATRLEVRTALELLAEVALTRSLFLVVDDTWIRNDARARHVYSDNVLSVGLEHRW